MAALTNTKRRKVNKVPILVVESNADQWLIIRSALAQCFPEVEPVWMNYGTQTLAYLTSCLSDEATLPRLILLNVHLSSPEEGWALLEAIKSHNNFRQIPVIVLSQSDDQQDIAKAYGFGVASYIVKPATYHKWLACFYTFRRYWWEAVRLPTKYLKDMP